MRHREEIMRVPQVPALTFSSWETLGNKAPCSAYPTCAKSFQSFKSLLCLQHILKPTYQF